MLHLVLFIKPAYSKIFNVKEIPQTVDWFLNNLRNFNDNDPLFSSIIFSAIGSIPIYPLNLLYMLLAVTPYLIK